MKPISFAERTVVIAENQKEYLPYPAYRFKGDPQGRIASCWSLTWRERFKVLFSGVIWQEVLTFKQPLQPQKLSAYKPDMPQ
jgi:hypothetical protein